MELQQTMIFIIHFSSILFQLTDCLLYKENNHHSFPKPTAQASNGLFGMTFSPQQKALYCGKEQEILI